MEEEKLVYYRDGSYEMKLGMGIVNNSTHFDCSEELDSSFLVVYYNAKPYSANSLIGVDIEDKGLIFFIKKKANEYLLKTDWVEPYLIKHYAGLEILPDDSSKFIVETKRKEAREVINELD